MFQSNRLHDIQHKGLTCGTLLNDTQRNNTAIMPSHIKYTATLSVVLLNVVAPSNRQSYEDKG
jgi:hypothetical protein